MKMVNETHKMLHDDSIAITATTVRVPVFRSHAESVYVETADELTVDAVRKAIDAFPGAQVQDNPAEMEYPMPLFTSENTTATSAVSARTCIIRRPSISGYRATRSAKALPSMPCRLPNTCWLTT